MDNIYQAPKSELVQEESDPGYAGFWVRFIASLIDSIWILALTLSLGWMTYGAVYFSSENITQGPADIFISYVLPFLITMAFWLYKSATPGKMLLGLKIVEANTLNKVSGGKLLLRYIGYFASLIIFGLGYLWVGWDKKKQGWHDKIAGTVVIKEK